MSSENLTLFFSPRCPFCKRVLDANKTLQIQLNLKDTSAHPEYRRELKTIGGKTQVPCLIIDGKPLYESQDIIAFLSERKRSSH